MARFSTRSLLLAAAIGVLVAACDSTPPFPPSDFQRAEMLEHVGRDIILPSYEGLQDAVNALDAAAETFGASPTTESLADLRSALKEARLAWQDANLFQFGPAESVTLRSSLNTYPADEDQIEENVESGEYVLGTIENRAAAGFPALGYLLHRDSDEAILTSFTDGPNASNRTAYLLDNVAFIKDAVDATVEEWSADGGNYIGTFLSEENAGSDVGSSLGMLVNAFVLHYERFIRDGKVGIPAGVRSAGVPRPTSTEAFYGGYSAELAAANVEAVKRLFLGNTAAGADGLGFDDNLEALDAGELSTQIQADLDQAISALDSLEDPLSEQIETNNEPVVAAFTELQDVLILLKADMTSVLGITITYQDNDGD